MARSENADKMYNTRRRLTRAAARAIKKAEQATGAQKARYEFQAEQHLKRAAGTYAEGKAIGKKVSDLAKRLGKEINRPKKIDIESIEYQSEKAKYRSGREAQREQSAREILNSNIGSRIIGAFESEWRDDPSNMLDIIKKRVGASDLMEVIEIIEKQVGEALYMEPGSDPRYDEVVELIKQAYNLR